MTRLSLAALGLIPLLLILIPTAASPTGPFSPCESSASSAGGVLLVCPAGDGPALADIGATISVTILAQGLPVPGYFAEDFWVAENAPSQTLCNGHLSCNADGPTDINGQTTISGSIAAGGYFGGGVFVVLQNEFICCDPCDTPLALALVSPDINGDLVVEGADFSLFAAEYTKTGGGTDPRMDFDGDGKVEATDFALFALHYDHACE